MIVRLIDALKQRIASLRKMKPKNEFRYNHQAGHMNYVFAEKGDEYRSVGLTTEDMTFGKTNMPLKNNPHIGDDPNKKVYVRNGIIADNKKSYKNKTSKSWEFSKDDMALVKSKIRNYKKSEKRRQKK